MLAPILLSCISFIAATGRTPESTEIHQDNISEAFSRAGYSSLLEDGTLKLLFLDVGRSQGNIPEHFGVNSGPFPWREGGVYLTDQYRDVGVTIVRSHDFFGPTDWYTIFPDWEADPGDPSSFDFAESDERILSIVDAGARVLFRIGVSTFSPRWARRVPEPQKFAQICTGIVKHYNQGWADGYELDIEYWEFWNEPNVRHYWTDTPQEFFEAYEATARALRELDPALKVGGPGLAAPFNEGNPFFTDFVRYCQDGDVPLDFFSWHHYEGFGEHRPSRYGEQASIVRTELDRYGFEGTESICDEYNSDLLTWFGSILGTAEQAAFHAIANIHMMGNGVAMTCFYRGTQWGNEGNIGLFKANGGYFPVSYAFKALSSMRETPMRVLALGSEDFYGILAGTSPERRLLRVLIADQKSDYRGYALLITGLDQFSSITVAGYLLDEDHDLELVMIREVPVYAGNSLVLAPMSSPSVHLLDIIPDEAPGRIWPTPE
jgi:hypothetical protein